ncbi:hypothetical protein [Loigolactobacillus zhaoyuanensis]|uniref:Uncharacterized protein n=1 Tax=Loigolactobacillus zhaoyuanensis TaxID=2486017 RepID=A0ABW8UEW1_9LACO|nr:hypothetical protein [Loigolactobacillus zhaoyuanensis]
MLKTESVRPRSARTLGHRLLTWPKSFAEYIQRPKVTVLPLAIEQVNERKLNRGPLYK